MAITAAEIQFLLSAPGAAAGYVMPGSAGNSLGKYVSTTQLSTASNGMDNLFLDLTGAQNSVNQVDYACVFVYNSDTTHSMLTPVAWLPVTLLGGSNTATFAVAVDPTPPSPLGQSTGLQAIGINSPTVAPNNITTWLGPSSSSAGGVSLPNIPAGNVQAVWIRRTANGSAGLNTFVLDITFDTLA